MERQKWSLVAAFDRSPSTEKKAHRECSGRLTACFQPVRFLAPLFNRLARYKHCPLGNSWMCSIAVDVGHIPVVRLTIALIVLDCCVIVDSSANRTLPEVLRDNSSSPLLAISNERAAKH